MLYEYPGKRDVKYIGLATISVIVFIMVPVLFWINFNTYEDAPYASVKVIVIELDVMLVAINEVGGAASVAVDTIFDSMELLPPKLIVCIVIV